MQTLGVGDHKRSIVKRKSFRPLLEDALQVLKSPLHNPEAKDFKKIMYVMKNCYFFRKNFSSQVALNEFVEFAKFYVGYEVHKYGSVLLHDREYADKLYILLEGTVDKISQRPYGEVEDKIKRRVSCLGSHENPHSPLNLQATTPRKRSEEQTITFKTPTRKTFLPSLHDHPHSLKKSESCISEGNEYGTSDTTNSIKRPSSPKPSSIDQIKDVQTDHSQQYASEHSRLFEDLIKFIAHQNPEVRRKYYTEDILRADRVKTFATGEYFGENFCIANYPKSNFMYAVSSPEAHLLTLKREDYHEIMRQLERKNQEKLEAFFMLFPSFDKDFVQRFSEQFSQKHFEVNEVIYFQGSSAQDLYILQSGGVQLVRNHESLNDKKGALLPIASVIKDQAFGEESLLMIDSRQETAVANVFNTSVFVLSASLLRKLHREFGSLLDELQSSAQEKFHWRQAKAQESSQIEETNSADSLGKPPLLPLRDVREVQNLYKPKHTIHIPYRRSFLSEKSPTHSLTSAFTRLLDPHSPTSAKSPGFRSLTGSPTFSSSTIKLRKFSDDEFHQNNFKANEVYKSQFGRTSVVPESLRTGVVHEKRSSLLSSRAHNISPGLDLKTMNFRKELYGNSTDSKQLRRFGKAAHDHFNHHESRQKRTIIIRKQVNHCDTNPSSPQNKQLQREQKTKPRTSFRARDYLPTCEILASLNKISVHWN